MIASDGRSGDAHRPTRESKRVSVNNLHLPPYPSEESLPRFDRWYIAHPYLFSVIVIIPVACLTLAYGMYRSDPLGDVLSDALRTGLGATVSSLLVTRYWRRLYRRPYRRDN